MSRDADLADEARRKAEGKERQVREALRLRAEGLDNAAISQRLGINRRTVERIFQRHRKAQQHVDADDSVTYASIEEKPGEG